MNVNLPQTVRDLVKEAREYAAWKLRRKRARLALTIQCPCRDRFGFCRVWGIHMGPEPRKLPKERHRGRMRTARNRRRSVRQQIVRLCHGRI